MGVLNIWVRSIQWSELYTVHGVAYIVEMTEYHGKENMNNLALH